MADILPTPRCTETGYKNSKCGLPLGHHGFHEFGFGQGESATWKMKAPTSPKEWPCDHIRKNHEDIWKFEDDDIVLVRSMEKWALCPFCGAKRPKEPDELDILKNILLEYDLKPMAPTTPPIIPAILAKFTLRKDAKP